MKLAFMTLGCPRWDLDTICRQGNAMGFQGVDLRGYLDTLDITTLPLFTTHANETKRHLTDAGLEVSAISSNITVCDEGRHTANIDEAKRTIDVCRGLGCRNIRVFGGGSVNTVGRDKALAVGKICVEDILGLDGAKDLFWLFETHDFWMKAADCALLLDRIPMPAFGALWDMGHTYRVGGEKPADTWKAIGARVGYTHVKDAIHQPGHPQSGKDGWRYVAPGEGTLPLTESIGLLRKAGWDGWLNFEHEKRWLPALPEPEEIFPQFITWARRVLAVDSTIVTGLQE
jgi:sugar phosphate isomerase/epimerase